MLHPLCAYSPQGFQRQVELIKTYSPVQDLKLSTPRVSVCVCNGLQKKELCMIFCGGCIFKLGDGDMGLLEACGTELGNVGFRIFILPAGDVITRNRGLEVLPETPLSALGW
eukprot:5931375-Amphidinium_carterae.1